jgi:hypothetical protein
MEGYFFGEKKNNRRLLTTHENDARNRSMAGIKRKYKLITIR